MSSFDYLDLCRLCLVKDQVSVPIFEGDGDARQIFHKISFCLPVKVDREDKLPKKICDDCAYKVELCYQFYNTTANAEKQLLQWLGEVGLEDKQDYEQEVMNSDMMKQEPDNRINVTVLSSEEQSNNMEINMIDGMSLSLPIIMTNQQMPAVSMSSTDNLQNIQSVAGTSVQTTRRMQKDGGHEEIEDTEEDDNSEDECDVDEGMQVVKEESENSTSGSRSMEPTTFVNVALSCNEAGPSGLQQQKLGEISEMGIQQSSEGDTKTGCVKVVDTSRVEVRRSTRIKILQLPKDPTENSSGRKPRTPVVNKNSVTAKEPILKYYCKSCGVVYSGRASDPQTEVFKRMHSKKHFTKCLQCPETFALAKDYLKHVDEAHELKYYKCEYCWYRTTSVRQYESHKRTKHRQVFTQAKKFSCGKCLKKDMTHSQYQIHLCEEDDIARKREKDKEGEILLCEFCGYTSRKKRSMKLHINQYHAERKFGCNICEKKFISDQGLVKHMNCHKNPVTRVGKLFCDHCGRGFKDKPALRMHIMNTHMGMKLAKCSICHKSFAKKTTLRQHLLTHSGKRPYTCDICGKTFVQIPALSSHRKQHPGKLPPMPVVYIDSYIRELDPSMVTSSIVPVPKLRTESQTYDDFRSNLKP